jgi:hypothetical protein
MEGSVGDRCTWRIILQTIKGTEYDSEDWIHMAQDKHNRYALVNIVMNFRGSVKGGKFLDRLKNYQVLTDFAPRLSSFTTKCILMACDYFINQDSNFTSPKYRFIRMHSVLY